MSESTSICFEKLQGITRPFRLNDFKILSPVVREFYLYTLTVEFHEVTTLVNLKKIITILAFSFCYNAMGQNIGVKFSDTLKTAQLYLSPLLPYTTIPFIWGVGFHKIGEPLDSIKFTITGEYSDTSEVVYKQGEELSVSVDTTQEINRTEYFLKSEIYKGFYPSPRRILTYDESGNKKPFVCNKDTSFIFKALPIYISNLTSNPKPIFIKTASINVFQEARDRNGKWRPIEIMRHPLCGNGFVWQTLKPGEQIITSVFKYKGEFETLLRVKLLVGGKKIYSKPFRGSVNYSQFNMKKIYQVEGFPHER